MRITVHHGQILIGSAHLEDLDPPMAVALGTLTPTKDYHRDLHANIIDGNYVGDKGSRLSIMTGDRGLLNVAAIAIQDWSDPDFGKQITVIFEDHQSYKAMFSSHHQYKAYFHP
jgi:hypothetical protein